ncbi:MAG: Restriction alleviation protein Lar [Ramlibacter sp.]|jgi:Lar family restriction alleviation protein|nr:Restriction alleviation protein Lar [Ramlibacter sp.]
MTELKPCPFCGGKAKLHDEQVAEDCMEAWVICDSCGASSERIEGAYSERPAAAAAWNRRTSPASPAQPITPEHAQQAFGHVRGTATLASDESNGKRSTSAATASGHELPDGTAATAASLPVANGGDARVASAGSPFAEPPHPAEHRALLACADAFERSADWLDRGTLQGSHRDFPLAGTQDYRIAAEALRRLVALGVPVDAPGPRWHEDLRALLLELRPMTAYGVVGSRDVDQARYRAALDGALALLDAAAGVALPAKDQQ